MARVIAILVDRWNIELHDVSRSDDPDLHTYYRNCSAQAGKDYICLGVYSDPELRLLSFFHELGHCVDNRCSGPRVIENPGHPYHHFHEASAWRTGLKIATKEGVTFSRQALAWAETQLSSYFKDDHPERSPLRFCDQATRYAFGG